MIRTFLTSMFGGWWLPVLAITLLTGAFGTGYIKGRVTGSQKAEVERLEGERDRLIADRERLNIQLRFAREAIAVVNRQSETDARIMGELKGKVDDYEQRLVDESGCFALSPDDVDVLQNIKLAAPGCAYDP